MMDHRPPERQAPLPVIAGVVHVDLTAVAHVRRRHLVAYLATEPRRTRVQVYVGDLEHYDAPDVVYQLADAAAAASLVVEIHGSPDVVSRWVNALRDTVQALIASGDRG